MTLINSWDMLLAFINPNLISLNGINQSRIYIYCVIEGTYINSDMYKAVTRDIVWKKSICITRL